MTKSFDDIKNQFAALLEMQADVDVTFDYFKLLMQQYDLTKTEKRQLGEMIFTKSEALFQQNLNPATFHGGVRIFDGHQEGKLVPYYDLLFTKMTEKDVANNLPLDAAFRLRSCAKNGLAATTQNCTEYLKRHAERRLYVLQSLKAATELCTLLFATAGQIEKADKSQLKKDPGPKDTDIDIKGVKISKKKTRLTIFNDVAITPDQAPPAAPADKPAEGLKP